MPKHDFIFMEKKEVEKNFSKKNKERCLLNIRDDSKYIFLVDDDIFLNKLNKIEEIKKLDTMWIYIGDYNKGFAYYGITIFDNEMLQNLYDIIKKNFENDKYMIKRLKIMKKAIDENLWLVHWGI